MKIQRGQDRHRKGGKLKGGIHYRAAGRAEKSPCYSYGDRGKGRDGGPGGQRVGMPPRNGAAIDITLSEISE